MSILIAAVVLVGLIGVVNLLLAVGVIKRLREHTELLSAGDRREQPVIGVGEEVTGFSTSTTDDQVLDRDCLDARTLIGFFSPTCRPCREKLPDFIEFARSVPGGRDRVVAAVVGEPDLAEAMVAELSPVARVVVEDHNGPLTSAFKVRAYPVAVVVEPDGRGRPVVVEERVELDLPVVAA